MATYDKLTYNIPAYQEGNISDFEFEMDDNFPIDQVSDITFQVRDNWGNIRLSNSISEGTIQLSSRMVTIPFEENDTNGKSGNHVYEIDFKNLLGKPFATIGGSFTINKQINTL